MEEAVHRIITELEAHHSRNDSVSATSISASALLELQALFDNINTFNTNGDVPEDIDCLWEALASKNISPAFLVNQITIAMDCGPIHLTLLASQVYLSILLSPNSPVFTLFSPVAFISLLGSIRRSLKLHQSGSPHLEAADDGRSRARKATRKRKGRVQGESSHNMSTTHGYGADAADDENDGNVQNRLFPVLEKLESVMVRIHLDRFPESMKSLIQTVAQIPVMALESYQSSASYQSLTNICFRILNAALRPEHGDQTAAAVEVLKSLSPAILLLKSQARTSAMNFVTHQMMAMAKASDAVRKAVIYLPRYLAQKAPEKSEPRASAVESIMDIVCAMEYDDQIGFADYVVKMTQGKAQLRLLAVDLVPMLLMSMSDPLGENVGEGVHDQWGSRCLEALIQRCSDVVSGIRARALTNLAQLVEFFSGDVGRKARLEEVMGFVTSEHKKSDGRMTNLLRKRCMDEKAAVRKAALLLITKSTSLLGKPVDEVLLKMMSRACSDPLVSIRKMAIAALSEVFRKFTDGSVITEWLQSVPCLITDNESSIQEECENLFLELVLNRVSQVGSLGLSYTKNHYSTSDVKMESSERDIDLVFSGGVLILLKGICDGEVTPNVKKICVRLGKKKRLKPIIAIALQNMIRTSETLWLSHSMPIQKWTAPPGAWLLLAEVSAFLPKVIDWEFLHHHWQLLDQVVSEGEVHSPLVRGDVDDDGNWIESNPAAWACDRVFLLQTISNVSLELPQEPAANLAHNLLKRIEEFNMHSTEVNAHVKALRTLCKQKANKEEGDALVLKWVQLLLSEALQILETYLAEVSRANKCNSFLTPPTSGVKTGKMGPTMSGSLLKAVIAVYTIGSLVMVCPSADLNGIIPILHAIITSWNSETKLRKLPGPRIPIKQIAPSLYIQSWLTLGKICLADATLAKRYIPLFVQELEKSDSAALRNNIIVIMADFCVHYTAVVDCYIPKITNCLRDPCEVVRRQTFILLSRLLQRDYVKWRGILFLRFLLSLVDESKKIRQLADFLFGNILKAKAPLLAYNSFVEAIFVLNDCHAHSGHTESQSSQSERQLFSIWGHDERSRSQRMHIYISLLKQMAPEHLLATSAKLCSEILAAASDGLLNLVDVTGQAVLQDALQILACKEMRIQSNCGSATDTTEMDEEGGDGGASLAAVRGRVAIQAVKKSVIQNAIPIFIELKRLLESKNSPLTGCLMECLRVLLKDYKNEIEDMLVADKQLQKELIYDMQKYEAAKAKSAVAGVVSSMQRPQGHRTPQGNGPAVYKHANETDVHDMLAEELGSALKVASAMADVAAEATARSVLREVNRGVSTPSLQSISMPKLKSSGGGAPSRVDRPLDVLESLRRRQSFDSDEEN